MSTQIADTIDTIGGAATPLITAIPGGALAAPFVVAVLALASAIARAGGTPHDIERLAPVGPELDAMRAEWARRAAQRAAGTPYFGVAPPTEPEPDENA